MMYRYVESLVVLICVSSEATLLRVERYFVQEYQMNLCNFRVEKKIGGILGTPDLSLLSTFVCPSRCTTVDVGKQSKSLHGECSMIVAGSADGHLYRMKLTLPTIPGSSPSAIRLDSADFVDTDLLVFAKPHRGCCSSVAVHEAGNVAASVSLDGTLCVSSLDGSSRTKASRVHYDSGGAVSFSTCGWTMSGDSLVTTSYQGAASVWDLRDARSTLRLGYGQFNSSDKIRGESLISLACNPAKSHVCVVGTDGGHLCEWDFRYPKEPTYIEYVDGSIKSIAYENQGSTVERLRFCTENGRIYKMIDREAHLLYEEPLVGFESMCVSSTGMDSQIFCSTQQEGLVYICTSSKFY